jgi:hypothetical protein
MLLFPHRGVAPLLFPPMNDLLLNLEGDARVFLQEVSPGNRTRATMKALPATLSERP